MGSKVLVISEIGVNHNGDIDLAREMIKASAEAGVDVVKFQSFRTEDLVTRMVEQADYQASNMEQEPSDQYKMLKQLELSPQDHIDLKAYAEACGVEFLSSPFDYKSLSLLVDLGLKYLKIPSGETQNGPLLFRIGQTGLPAILSTGMTDLNVIKTALAILAYGYLHPELTDQSDLSIEKMMRYYETEQAQKILKEKITILHCTTSYPTPLEIVNLRAMDTISRNFGLPVGYSDHTQGSLVSLLAVSRGATVIEKHFTLDRNLLGPDHKASMEPEDFKKMVEDIREIEKGLDFKMPASESEIEKILGVTEKNSSEVERQIAKVACKKLVFSKALRAGDVITEGSIIPKRASGDNTFSANDFWKVLGVRVMSDVDVDQVVTPLLLEQK